MSFSIPSFSEIIRRSKETYLRFPLSMTTSLLVALISIYLIEIEPKKMEGAYLILAKMVLTGSLGVFVFTAQRLLGEQMTKTWHTIWMLVSIAGILLYYYVLPDSEKDFTVYMIPFRHFFLSLLFVISFLWTPFLKTVPENADYWEYAKHIMFSLVMTFLFTIVVILGINGALFAIEKLFDIDIAGKRYFQMDILIIGTFSVGYFLSQIPLHPKQSKFVVAPPKVESFFTKWLLTPLSALYFVILYTYTLKIIIVQDWPKGVLAWLIVAFSAVAILTYLFWTHFAGEENKSWRRWIWLIVLIQTVMLFIAIGIRIEEYSWTESRYMVFVLGVWLAVISLYFLVYSKAKIKWIFISLSALIALSQIGPLSAYVVSRTAQETRLLAMVAKIKTYHPTSKAPIKLRYEISDGIQYLYNRYRGKSLSKVFPKITKQYYLEKETKDISRKKEKSRHPAEKLCFLPEYITDALGFKYINRWEYKAHKNGSREFVDFTAKTPMQANSRRMLDVNGYGHIAQISKYGYDLADIKEGPHDVSWKYQDSNISLTYTKEFRLVVSSGSDKVIFDLGRHFSRLVAKYGNESKDLKVEELRLQKQTGHLKVKLEISSLNKQKIGNIETLGFIGVLFVGESK